MTVSTIPSDSETKTTDETITTKLKQIATRFRDIPYEDLCYTRRELEEDEIQALKEMHEEEQYLKQHQPH